MLIGVLAMQGAFREHQQALTGCGVESVQIRRPEQLADVDGLIIPGGESTAIAKLMINYDLFERVKELGEKGMPIFGTCAGMILLAREIEGSDQPRLGLMEIKVRRNAYGRQVDSFEEDLEIPVLGKEPFRAVFIRAPQILEAKNNVEVLARQGEKIVLAQEGNFLAAAFHPELTDDLRLHKYFLEIVKKSIA
ncbi:MAG: pyridoxal 5'-phosphate synthase glutaminase subunit PdxT [Armatimonadetes bacterium]|nr:pyridoxal 5'-phosphate synthase glutaminase subunit PdxT [Armatimonadota bacterium]